MLVLLSYKSEVSKFICFYFLFLFSAELFVNCFIVLGQQERKKVVEYKSTSDCLLSINMLLCFFSP